MPSPIRLLSISGTPFERGLAHGQAFAYEIRLLTEERLRLSTMAEWTGRAASPEEVRALGEACLAHHEAFAPLLMEELRGIAAGAGVDEVDLLIMNGFTDFIDVVFTGPDDDPGGCTAFAIGPQATADGRGYLGQTWDMHASATPHVVLLDVKPDEGPRLLTFTLVGCVGMIGMNEHGVAVSINNLKANDGRPGVTWPFVIRQMLAQTTVDDALAVLLGARLAGAHNYLLMGADGRAFNVEAMATRAHVTPVEPAFIHTNHCLAPDLLALERPRTAFSTASTTNRLDQATRFLDDHPAITFDDLVALTRYHEEGILSVCAHPQPDYDIESSGACIMSPTTRELWAAWGNPCQNEYTRFVVAAEGEIRQIVNS